MGVRSAKPVSIGLEEPEAGKEVGDTRGCEVVQGRLCWVMTNHVAAAGHLMPRHIEGVFRDLKEPNQ